MEGALEHQPTDIFYFKDEYYAYIHYAVCQMHNHQETSPLSALDKIIFFHRNSLSMVQVINKVVPQLQQGEDHF